MSKYVNVTVSASLSTDFFIEVSDNATKEQIQELAKKEVLLPNKYPEYIYNLLQSRFGIRIGNLDSMLKSWNIDELTYIVDGGYSKTSEGKQSNA